MIYSYSLSCYFISKANYLNVTQLFMKIPKFYIQTLINNDFCLLLVNIFYVQTRQLQDSKQKLILSKAMGICNQVCLNANVDETDDALPILPKGSLSSIKWSQKESLSTDDSLGDSSESPEDDQHLCTAARCFKRGKYQQAINEYMLALHTICKDSFGFVQVHARIANSYLRMGRHRLAEQHCKIALEKSQEKCFREEAALSAQLMGEIKLGESDTILAIYNYEKAMRGFEQLGQQGKQMEVMYCLGIIHMELKSYDKVLKLYQPLAGMKIDQDQSNMGPLFWIHLSLAKIYTIQGRYNEGIESFAQCLQLVVEKSEQYREAVFEFRKMCEYMKRTCSFDQLLQLHSVISSTSPLNKLTRL